MAQQSDFKIRVLPRKGETAPPAAEPASASGGGARSLRLRVRPPEISRRTALAATAIVVAVLALSLAWQTPEPTVSATSQKSTRDPMINKISRLVEDTRMRAEVQRQRRQLDNMRSREAAGTADLDVPAPAPEQARSFGVQMDTENTADRLYQELNDRPRAAADNTPDDRINAMLEKNKWLNEQERQERVQYVRNFIKTAYDRGYEVQLDDKLQVVGVRPIQNRKVSLDQVIDKVSRQGI